MNDCQDPCASETLAVAGDHRPDPGISVTILRRNTAAVLALVRDPGSHVTITRRGRPVAVLMSLESYERIRHDIETARASAARRPA